MMLLLAILSLLLRLTFSSSLPEFDEQCPFQNVCKDNSDRTTRNNISLECCSPCSCSDACILTGICCPGHNNILEQAPRFPCRPMRHIYERYLKRSAKFIGSLSYRVIDECPVEYETVVGNEEKLSRCKLAEGAIDLVFVTGRLSGLTYLNEHCARCNGEYDFVHWNLYLYGMENNLVFSSFEERDDILLRTSYFKTTPPSAHVALLSFCNTGSIGRCNVTGLWDYYDRDLEINCLSYHSYFSVDDQPNTFSNVYCYMCNFQKGILAHKQCTILNEVNKLVTRSIRDSFHALIIPSKKTSDISLPVQNTCLAGEILDTVLDRCTSLICPPASIPDQGICQPAMEQIAGYAVLLRLELIIDSKADLQPTDYGILLTDLEFFTQTITRKRRIKCDVCTMRIIQLQDDTIYFEVEIVSGKKCDHIALLENMFLIYKTLPVVVYLENLEFNVTLSYGIDYVDYTSVKEMEDSLMPLGSTCSANIVYAPTVVHCPSLIFNKTTMSKQCNDSCFHTKINPFSLHLGNGTYIMCIDHYKKALMNESCIIGFDMSVKSILLTFYSLHLLIHIQMHA